MESQNKQKIQKTESKTAEEKSHPGGASVWRSNARTEHSSGAERPEWEHPGAERPEQAWFWRSTPEMAAKGS